MIFRDETYSVLLVSASDKFNATTTTLLPVTDYWPVTTVKSIAEAKRRLLDQPYDIILINAPLPDDFGMRLAIDADSGALGPRGDEEVEGEGFAARIGEGKGGRQGAGEVALLLEGGAALVPMQDRGYVLVDPKGVGRIVAPVDMGIEAGEGLGA